ncbi:hypothetical protein AXG93_861s1000 [Marchantia polymorpha subsp. ruderalis]|uniref:Uncharacterized protein n=1 Tax=Marchantia polymorpha subsp. ruderalis TaxID=1480154 RepID=A0A176VJJ6_MARPO|nr:hypothetical protein AXG93_861s1000 [Marchantia polymorpha subsp. ruderalis]
MFTGADIPISNAVVRILYREHSAAFKRSAAVIINSFEEYDGKLLNILRQQLELHVQPGRRHRKPDLFAAACVEESADRRVSIIQVLSASMAATSIVEESKIDIPIVHKGRVGDVDGQEVTKAIRLFLERRESLRRNTLRLKEAMNATVTEGESSHQHLKNLLAAISNLKR